MLGTYPERVRRFFNTAGPCEPERHYMVPPEPRLPSIRRHIDRMGYVVVHGPRQTGKTTTLRALVRALNAEGRYAAVHTTCETGASFGDDVGGAEDAILAMLRARAEDQLPEALWPPAWPTGAPASRLHGALRAWARACTRPLLLVLDEIDALRGPVLQSVLSQLRAGYDARPASAPWSVVLAGLRDVRDYRPSAAGSDARLGSASPFNIKIASLTVPAFGTAEIAALLDQHTRETGQRFTRAATERVVALAAGQPWLTNALAARVTDDVCRDVSAPIDSEHVDQAKEQIILARETHLDSLAARLDEPRVRRIIAAIVGGAEISGDAYHDDVAYVRDLGLVAAERPARIANPIYREVIVRILAAAAEDNISAEPGRFVLADGRIDTDEMLRGFAEFWVEHGEILTQKQTWHEVAPQLVMMAWLHRVVNGGGYIDREYGVGRGRIDLLIRWPYTDARGTRAWQRNAIELKVRAPGQPDPTPKGLRQLDGYLDRLGLDRGTLVVFDRRPDAPSIDVRTRFERVTSPTGRAVTLLVA